MKVISQLASHFWQQGLLSQEVAEFLVESGFVPQHVLPGFERPTKVEPDDEQHVWNDAFRDDAPLEAVEESLVRIGVRTGKRGAAVQPVCSVAILRERIRQELERRREALHEVLPKFAVDEKRLSWQAAASRLRKVTIEECAALLQVQLRLQRIRLNPLWNAVNVEPFANLLQEHEKRGRVARAWQTLLQSCDASTWGNHAWLLKFDEVQFVNNLHWIHQGLLLAISRVMMSERGILQSSVDRQTAPELTWSLIILHSALRLTAVAPLRRQDFGPIGCPAGPMLQRALRIAMKMNSEAVGALLLRCSQEAAPESDHYRVTLAMQLYCPAGWRVPAFNSHSE